MTLSDLRWSLLKGFKMGFYIFKKYFIKCKNKRSELVSKDCTLVQTPTPSATKTARVGTWVGGCMYRPSTDLASLEVAEGAWSALGSAVACTDSSTDSTSMTV